MSQSRTALFSDWLKSHFSQHTVDFCALPGDASFRRYFRLVANQQTYIAVDAPPETENNHAFITVSNAFASLNLTVPTVIAADLHRGFLLLSDLGDAVFLRVVNETNADQLYRHALMALGKIQTCMLELPTFDTHAMHNELHLFLQWLVKRHVGLSLSSATQKMIEHTFSLLLTAATEQPQCCIHRDYHSRNLMVLDDNHIGILDFQDAMRGPITYDLVSLLRDCYIDWPMDDVQQWALFYHAEFAKAAVPSAEQFLYWFDWMGIQRHLKASFIFARKWRRDGVGLYLNDIPRALQYILTVSEKYPQLRDFRDWLGNDIAPVFC